MEIDKQTIMVGTMNQEMDKTLDKMNFVMKRLSALMKTNDAGTLYTIMCLSLILIVMVVLVVAV